MAILGFVVVLLFGLGQLVAGYAGIEHHLGMGWGIAALAAALLFRFTLPITIGAFFGAMDVWHWHWAFAALFAMPGLLFIIPGAFVFVASLARDSKDTKPQI
jgi:hypothetical protein